MPAATPFVLLFEARSGSTYLVEALDRHPEVAAQKEDFAARRDRIESGLLTTDAQLRWAEEFYRQPSTPGAAAWGFKTKLDDILDREGFARLLRERGARLLVLTRRNRVKLVVSRWNAMRLAATTGDWNLYRPGDRPADPLTIAPADFAEWLAWAAGEKRALDEYRDALGLPTLELQYEGLLADRRSTIDQACEFLGVAPQPLAGAALKVTGDDLRSVLANFDELRAHFAGTPYHAMFDERTSNHAPERPAR